MFSKLRNRFILTNVIFSTAILLISFGSIYYVAALTTDNRLPSPDDSPSYTNDVHNIINERIDIERRASLNTLLITLIVVGGLIEFLVVVFSYYFAEKAIEPVKNAYNLQKTFIANASHEIKTPLASIQANLEAADITDNRFIDNIEYEANKLAHLNQELLQLAKADNISEATTVEADLNKLIDENLKPFMPRIEEHKIKLNFKNNKVKKVKINQNDFSQIFNILMDNAIKYCERRIDIKLTDDTLAITNDGAKIKKADEAQIFERFYQSDKSAEGVGLGLSIAKSLAERNHWEITASSNKLTTFSVHFKV